MILINLLPHREVARKKRRELFYVTLGASAVLGGVVAGVIFSWYQAAISAQQSTNTAMEVEIKKLESQIKDIVGLEAEIAAVEDLQSDRNLPVHLLTELVNQLPDGVFISKMAQTDQLVTINGTAQTNERVSELLRNLANNTPWFSKPELVEIVAGSVALTPRDQRRVANFAIRVKLVRASEAEKAAAAALSAASSPEAVPVPAAASAVGNVKK